MMDYNHKIAGRIFSAQQENGFWKTLPESHKYYPDYMHYVPNFKATLWTLILLADLGHPQDDVRVQKPLEEIKKHFFSPEYGIHSLKEDHFPIPCLNGNMIYIDSYFNASPDEKSLHALNFFTKIKDLMMAPTSVRKMNFVAIPAVMDNTPATGALLNC